MQKHIRTSIYLPAAMKSEVQRKALEQTTSSATVIRQSIISYLEWANQNQARGGSL